MPWSSNEEIIRSVSALSALPGAAVTLFRGVANDRLGAGDDESTALRIAWGVVKKRFTKTESGWVARSDAFDEYVLYTFDAKQAESFITRSDSGRDLHNYVLTDILPDSKGTAPTPELMNEWASWINKNQPEGDVDHEIMRSANDLYKGDITGVKNMVRSKKGIAKAVRAFIQNGQLIVSLAFDDRYKNHISRVKGLSIEALAVKDALTGRFKSGELLGFTLAMNSTPLNPRSAMV